MRSPTFFGNIGDAERLNLKQTIRQISCTAIWYGTDAKAYNTTDSPIVTNLSIKIT
jgi:hypothetical protein